MATIITITLKSADEVHSELRERLPAATLASLTVDIKGTPTPWVWVSGDTKSIKDVLKEIGFKWSSKREAWYHTCETDMTKRSFGGGRGRRYAGVRAKAGASTAAPASSAPPRPKYQATSNIDEEFARRFG